MPYIYQSKLGGFFSTCSPVIPCYNREIKLQPAIFQYITKYSFPCYFRFFSVILAVIALLFAYHFFTSSSAKAFIFAPSKSQNLIHKTSQGLYPNHRGLQ